MEKRDNEHTKILEMMMNSKDGKGRSPNGKLRKQAKKPGTAGPISRELFSDDEDDDDEEQEEGAGTSGSGASPEQVNKINAIQALKQKLDEAWVDSTISWNNKAAERKFDESAPLAGLQDMCGVNQGLNTKRIPVDKLTSYMMGFTQAALEMAVTLAREATVFWKSYQQPGRKIDLGIKTYGVEISGCAIRRKPWLALFCTLVAAKRANVAVPDPEIILVGA